MATWAELQKALDDSQPNEFVHIWMKGDITAAPTEGPLTVSGSKTIKIHMEGHTLSRGLTDPTDNESLRIVMAEALGWFCHSVEREKIAATLSDCLARDKSLSPRLRREMTKAVKRIQGK